MSELQLDGDWSFLAMTALIVSLGSIAWWLYRQELDARQVEKYHYLLPCLRCAALAFLILTLLQPTWQQTLRIGQPGKLHILLDGSQSMSIVEPTLSTEIHPGEQPATRFDRALKRLSDADTGWLNTLVDHFDITLSRIEGVRVVPVWQHSAGKPTSLQEIENQRLANRGLGNSELSDSWSAVTALGDALAEVLVGSTAFPSGQADQLDESASAINQTTGSPTKSFVVLLSDGQSNFGRPALEVAQKFEIASIPIYSIGCGQTEEPADLAIATVQTPKQVYRNDTLRGQILLNDRLPQGTPFRVELLRGEETVWSQSLSAKELLNRKIEFAVPVQPLFSTATSLLPRGAQYAAWPLKLSARVSSEFKEINRANNSADVHLMVTSQKSKCLLLDGRSRWESRYLKNLFQRDPAWELTECILPTASLATSEHFRQGLPASREKLFEYDLIILGDLPATALTSPMLDWIHDFVQHSGGGLICVDGSRKHLQHSSYSELHRMLPIRWLTRTGASADGRGGAQRPNDESLPARQMEEAALPTGAAIPKQVSLTIDGQQLPALDLLPKSDNPVDAIWNALPPVQFVANVEALKGSTTLVEANCELGTQPLLVVRQYGAGKVLYCATDETWRWRYRLADEVHGRLWNQLARFVMRPPMSIESDFVSLDTGQASYSVGDSVAIRCRLRQQDGRPAEPPTVHAIVHYRHVQSNAGYTETVGKASSRGRRSVTEYQTDDSQPADFDGELETNGAIPPESRSSNNGKLPSDDFTSRRIPMVKDDNVPGAYCLDLENLQEGEYRVQVEAAGFNSNSLAIESRFSVVSANNEEMQRIACNESLLRTVANETGGMYFHETQMAQLASHLKPLSNGYVERIRYPIWATYGWFSIAILLLVSEWLLRKRAGLI